MIIVVFRRKGITIEEGLDNCGHDSLSCIKSFEESFLDTGVERDTVFKVTVKG